MSGDRAILESLFEAALGAALPDGKFEDHLPLPPAGRTIVVGAGKGSARMAQAFEAVWPHPCSGLVVTRYGHAAPTRFIEIVEAAHPIPDDAGQRAAMRILERVRAAGADDLVVCLISGGASALLTLPAPGVTLSDKQEINRALLRSGAAIGEINTVRKALSAIKGGRLAAAASPARLVTYLISDVPGDDAAAIGSGPTVPEVSDPEAALAVLRRYAITISEPIERAIGANLVSAAAAAGPLHMLATPRLALEAAAARARELGVSPLILGDAIEGEAREVGRVMAGIARSVLAHGHPIARPAVLLSGGETTVTVRGTGRGGRNAEFLLATLMALGETAGVSALACDTDGIDGMESNAGAWFDAETLALAKHLGLSPRDHLDDNDAYSFFERLERLVVTGPTLTNVNDFRAILIR